MIQNSNFRVIVQGITGSEGMRHTARMLKAGTKIVAGVNPRKAGEILDFEGVNIPVFASVKEAKNVCNANSSVIFVPPKFAKDAVNEAIGAEIPLVVIITEGIPLADEVEFTNRAKKARLANRDITLLGPNCPGAVFSSKNKGESANLGIIPNGLADFGPLALVSKSGTLTYQMMAELADIGFCSAVGIGGDPCPGSNFIDWLEQFEADERIEAIVLIGEIGGDAEERAAMFIRKHISKPVYAYIAGVTAPPGKTMGHAGAIISGTAGSAASKQQALENAGVKVGKTLAEVAKFIRNDNHSS